MTTPEKLLETIAQQTFLVGESRCVSSTTVLAQIAPEAAKIIALKQKALGVKQTSFGRSLIPTDWKEEVWHIHMKVVKRWLPASPEDKRFLSLALCGEVGELANKMKKDWRGDDPKPSLESIREEIADAYIYLYMLARCFGLELDECAESKLPEIRRRWPDAVPKPLLTREDGSD